MTDTRQSDIERAMRGPMVGIALVAFVAMVWFLNFAEDVLVPLAISILLWAIVSAQARAIQSIPLGTARAPEWMAMTFAIATTLGVVYAAGSLISDNTSAIIRDASTYGDRIREIFEQASMAVGVEDDVAGLIEQINISNMLGNIIANLSDILGKTIIILIYTGFLIAEQSTFDIKIKAMFRDKDQQAHIVRLFSTLARRIQDYVAVKTLMSLITAGLSYAVLRYLDVNFAGFWAFLIFLLNYVPTVGSILGVVFPALQTLLQYDVQTFLVVVAVLGLVPQFTIGNIVEPKVMGQSLNLSPVVILVSLTFWGIIWSVPGLFLAVPITVILMIICAHFGPTQWAAIILSRDGQIVREVAGAQRRRTA
ncbi:MAG: AI-2E family transporter [Alphaproteobacteria bacterium]